MLTSIGKKSAETLGVTNHDERLNVPCILDPGQRRAAGVRKGEAEPTRNDVSRHCDYRGGQMCESGNKQTVHSHFDRKSHERRSHLSQTYTKHETTGMLL